MKVLVPLAYGFEEIEAVAIIDVLRRADIEVLMASLNEDSLVKGANGILSSTPGTKFAVFLIFNRALWNIYATGISIGHTSSH